MGDPALVSLRRVVAWYFAHVYGVTEGPGVLPFYCDPSRVGRFAVEPEALAGGYEEALFRLLVALSMYQARRDVVIMAQQRRMTSAAVTPLSSPRRLRQLVKATNCERFGSAEGFDAGCDVAKVRGMVDCGWRPGAACHVKEATVAFRRMGDSGKLPTSAWLHLGKNAGLRSVLAEVLEASPDPARRAELLVARLERVHRVGRKLATLFVAAVSTPALAPGLTPWFPAVDGNSLVVVDTHVARAIDVLRPAGAARTYDARTRWLKMQAGRLDLREFRPDVPGHAPRLIQQSLYAFGSKSNRTRAGDECAAQTTPCNSCEVSLCPFTRAARSRPQHRRRST